VWAAVVAVAGTLLGSTVTYVFQRLTVGRTERFARAERMRQEQIAAYSAFAGAAADLRRGLVTMWFRRADADLRQLHIETDQLGAVAAQARFRVQLVAADPAVVDLAVAALGPVERIPRAADRAELLALEAEHEQRLTAFVTAASRQLVAQS
jgi:hypothetical protein